MKIQWFLPGLCLPGLMAAFLAAPAEAGNLSSWQFDSNQNRLEFSTDASVQPRAQLISNPTRLLIDLPGINLERLPIDQQVGGAVQRVQIIRLDSQTSRIVVELAPGYTLDPQQIQFRGETPQQWIVQLPQPQVSSTLPTAASAPLASPVTSPGVTAMPPTDPTITQVSGVRVTADGLFVQTRGNTPRVQVQRSRDRRAVTVNIANAVLTEGSEREMEIDRFGVDRLQLSQTADTPPGVQLVLEVDRDSSDWQASASNLGGIVMLRTGNGRSSSDEPVAISVSNPANPARESNPARDARESNDRESNSSRANPRRSSRPVAETVSSAPALAADPAPSPPSDAPQPATIQGVELNAVNNQLLIQSDRPVAHTSQWDSGVFQISLSPARLADRVSGPQLNADSLLRRVRLRQDNDETVVISVQPATGVRLGSLNAISGQLLALELERSTPPTVSRSPATSSRLAARSTPSRGTEPLPIAPTGRLVVAIDPGHGGADVGAVGINSIHEADIVLSISEKVAELLEQQGIQVVLTRTDDREIDLEPRVAMAEQVSATVFVSIHANSISMDRPDVNGVETYYYSSGEALADTIHSSIVDSLDVTDRGVRQARFYVLRHTSMPAVLVETGFVTGSEDAPRLADRGFQNQMAMAIARGILQYLQQTASR